MTRVSNLHPALQMLTVFFWCFSPGNPMSGTFGSLPRSDFLTSLMPKQKKKKSMWQPEIQTPSTNALQRALWLCTLMPSLSSHPSDADVTLTFDAEGASYKSDRFMSTESALIGLWGDKKPFRLQLLHIVMHSCMHTLTVDIHRFFGFFYTQYFTTEFGSWAVRSDFRKITNLKPRPFLFLFFPVQP